MQAIDIHFHVVPELFVDAVRRGDLEEAVVLSISDGVERFDFRPPPGVPTEPDTALQPEMHDERLILAALDRRKLSAAVVSAAPEMFMSWAPPKVEEKIAAAMNEGIAQLTLRQPGRLFGLASLPLHDGAVAARVLAHAVLTLGLSGAAICTHVNGLDLDEANLEPLFAMAANLDAPLFLHPQNFGDLRRMADYHLWNVVGFPFETALTAARLVMSGVLERHPGLKVILAHGGGYFPYQIGRLDHAWRSRKALRETLPRLPSSYLRQIFCDTLVHDPRALRFLVDRFGPDQIVLGSDYPFGMGSDAPVDAVTELRLGDEAQTKILSGNLGRLLRLGVR